MKILVTGGAGYIGTPLCQRLAERHEVVCWDPCFFGAYFDSAGPAVELVRRRVQDLGAADLERLRPDWVLHLSGLSNDPMADFAPKMNWVENMEACVLVGERTNALGIPVVFASSASVYGFSPGAPRTESDPVAPIGYYSKAKAAAEAWFLAHHRRAIILRQATVMGVSPRMRFDLLTNGMTKDAWAKGRLPVLYGGREVRAQVHVLDLVDAYESVLATPGLAAGVYNVSATNDRVMELAERIQTQLSKRGREVRLDVTDEPRQPRSYALTSEKLSNATGWQPKRTVAATVDELCEHVDRAGAAVEDPRAYNIRWMKLVFESQDILDRVGRISLDE